MIMRRAKSDQHRITAAMREFLIVTGGMRFLLEVSAGTLVEMGSTLQLATPGRNVRV